MLGLGLSLGDGGRVLDVEIPQGVPVLTELPFDGYVFDAGTDDIATVCLKGSADAGRELEVRAFSPEGSTRWLRISADGNGEWSTTFDVPNTLWDNWFTPQARYGAGGEVAEGLASFGCGTVLGFMGQSEITHFHGLGSTYNPLPYPALLDENLTVLLQADDTGVITPRRITTADSSTVNLGLVAIANALSHVGALRKFMFVDMNQPGTSRTEFFDDNDPERSFSHLTDLVALVRSGGSDVGLVIENWYNADAASIPTFGPAFAPWYFGQRWGGEPFTLGTVNPDNTIRPGVVYDHCLWDIEAPSDQTGRGVFARARTKLAIMGPMPFHDTPIAPSAEWANYTGSGARNIEPARDVVEAFTQDSRVQTFCAGYGPSTHLCDFGGGIHPLADEGYGTVQFALSHLPVILNWMGSGVAEPDINGVDVAPDGSYADVRINLPNGGMLTTLRALESLDDPIAPPPQFQAEGTGFEIARAGVGRRPVFALAETAYPAAFRGTVSIADAGSGMPRQGVVRITPEQPFGTGDQISYLLGQATAHLLEPRDVEARLFLDHLIEHIPALYDGGSDHPFRGVPVKPHHISDTIVLPSTFAARAARFDGASGYADTNINVPASSAGTMSFWFKNNDSSWNATPSAYLCEYRVGFKVAISIRAISNNRMQFGLFQDGVGTDTVNTPVDTFVNGQWHHVAWSWDKAQGRFQIFVDGVAIATTYAFSSDQMELEKGNLNRIGIGGGVSGSNQIVGDLGHFWFDPTQSLDLSDPYMLERFLAGSTAADLGATGELPTGAVPAYYYDGDGASWANLGSAGNVTLIGALSTSPTVPHL